METYSTSVQKTPSGQGGSIILQALTRRLFLKAVPAAGVAVALPMSAAMAKTSAEERLAHHFSEFKKAAIEIDPRVRFSKETINFNSPHAPIIIIAQWSTGFYDGDGVYAGSGDFGQDRQYTVALLDYPINGERGFSVIPHREADRSKWMRLSETQFEAFIGMKIQGGQI